MTKKRLAVVLAASMIFSSNVATAFAAEENLSGLNTETAIESIEEVDAQAEETADAEQPAEDVTDADEETKTEDAAEDTEAEVTVPDESKDDADTPEEEVAAEDEMTEEAEPVDGEVLDFDQENLVSDLDGLLNSDPEYVSDPMIKATLSKKYRVSLSWKKVSGCSYYQVWRMRSDAEGTFELLTPESGVKATKYTDKYAKDAQTLIYKVVPIEKSTGYEKTPKYVAATPAITSVQRESYSREDVDVVNTLDIDVTTIPGALGHRILRAMAKSTEFSPFDGEKGLVLYEDDGEDLGPSATAVGIFSEAGVKQTRFLDANDRLSYGRSYNYKATTIAYIPEADSYIESSYSKAVSGVVTERAPEEAEVLHLSGTRLLLAFEDMTKSYVNNDEASGRRLASATDTYNIYAAMKKPGAASFGKYKKIASMQASSATLKKVAKGVVYSTSEELSAEDKTKKAEFDCVTYVAKNLKPQMEYSFKVQLVKSGLAAAKSEGAKSKVTELNDLTKVTVTSANFDAISVSWDQVEGATGYQVYVAQADTDSMANTMSTNTSWISNPDESYWIKAKADKNGICTTVVKKCGGESLENETRYVVAIRPTGYQKTLHDQATYAAGWAKTKIAAPKVTVKQSHNTLQFKWKKVNKASGYVIEYNGGSPKFFSKNETSYIADDDFAMGQHVKFRITTLYDLDESNYKSHKSEWGNYTELDEAIKPTTPIVRALLFNKYERTNEDGILVSAGNETGALIVLNESEATEKYSGYPYMKNADNMFLGYRVYRSHKKGSAFVEVKHKDLTGDFLKKRSEVAGKVIRFEDDTELVPGTKYYYRIYALAKYGDEEVVESRTYATATYCTPTSVSGTETTVKIGSKKSVSLKFKPDYTTMKEVRSWAICDSKKNEIKSISEAGTITAKVDASGKSVEALSLTTTNYGQYTNGDEHSLSPKVTIKGIRKGTYYLRATLVNDMETYIKVHVEEKEVSGGSSSSKKLIILDPGHGTPWPGATNGGLVEKTLNLRISNYTKNYLEEMGYTVYLTREDDYCLADHDDSSKTNLNKDLKLRAEKYYKKDPACFVSQHINSGGGKGVECYYYSSSDAKSISLATKMSSETASSCSMNNRGAKQNDYLVLKRAYELGMTAALMENGFIDNASDHEKLGDTSWLKKIAKANATGIDNFLKKK